MKRRTLIHCINVMIQCNDSGRRELVSKLFGGFCNDSGRRELVSQLVLVQYS